jgi:molecular chaperone GrpE (heat shock protein)
VATVLKRGVSKAYLWWIRIGMKLKEDAMFSKFMRFFKKDKGDEKLPSTKEIMEEIEVIKKIFRKQGLSLDLFRKEVLEKLEERRTGEVEHFFRLAEAFFYHDRSLKEIPGMASSQQEALAIVWHQLEALLSSVGIEIIRRVGVDFDPRLYEAVERVADGNGRPVVRRVIQPGFIHEGRVIKPAKAVIEREKLESKE